MMQRLSDVKLGMSLGIFEGITSEEIEKLSTKCQPASIETAIGNETTPEDRDAARAKAVRIALKDCNVY